MPATRFVRLVVRVPPTIPVKYQQLADRFGYTRSELYRVALDQNLPAVARWCERSATVLDGDLSSLVADAESPGARGFSSTGSLAHLTTYAKTLVSQSPTEDVLELKRLLRVKADDLGLSRAQSDPYVEVLAVGVLQLKARAARTSKRSSSPSGDPSSATPNSSSDDARSSESDLDSDLHDVPELD